MAFIDNLKQFFGLGSGAASSGPDGARPEPVPAESPEQRPIVPPVAPPPDLARGTMPATPQQREQLYRFVVDKLAAYVSETDGLPVGLTLWIRCASPEEEDRMGVALYAGQPGHFKAELSRHLANQYIKLAPAWQFDWQFVRDALPPDCTYQQGNLGLTVVHPQSSQPLRARLRTLTGQTIQETYLLDPAVQAEFRIGRGDMVQTASGRVRTNDIAFVDSGEPHFDPQRGEPNLSVSRQHATIRYDAANRQYRLFADAGGLPANGNKTKILRVDDTVERADLPGVGYRLAHADQIELGGEAKLLIEML
ncbi:FHA domain-containing protein [Rudanella paleaurantiibacter]|uniref:FHA domain-containing protein n=1 Tax=Rudanella paleaurantiibacter TaxID=2614655 RepID=A0A7J5U5F7_9BACT|nr:FHA domain-containing protein [Rudanella paleaurantiibacter]KAB7733074.1 FHA domain-containing protein [Rudanella paleaurantiibacter]